jgi:hypothetical protein
VGLPELEEGVKIIDIRNMRRLTDALTAAGVSVRNPSGGGLHGIVQIGTSSIFLRLDVSGEAYLYDQTQGSPNHRIPLNNQKFKVDLHTRGWDAQLAALIAPLVVQPPSESTVKTQRGLKYKPPPTARAAPWKNALDPKGQPIEGLFINGETGEFDWDPLPDGTQRPLKIKSRNSLYLSGRYKSALNMAEAVLRTFVGPSPEGMPYAAFLNASRVYPRDYVVSNLRWQAKRQTLHFPEDELPQMIQRWAEGASASEIAVEFNTTQSHVHNIIEGQDSNGGSVNRDLDPVRLAALSTRLRNILPDDPPAMRLKARFQVQVPALPA